MKNDVQIIRDIQEYILSTELASEVTGTVKESPRPRGSVSEDVIISILANENAQVQESTVNVNIYVRDEDHGRQKNPDNDRLDYLADLSQRLLKVINRPTFRASLKSQRITQVGEDEHVITNKLKYKHLNS